MKPTDEQIEQAAIANAEVHKDDQLAHAMQIDGFIKGSEFFRDFPKITHEHLANLVLDAIGKASQDPNGLPALARIDVFLEHVGDFSPVERRSMFMGMFVASMDALYNQCKTDNEELNQALRKQIDSFILIRFGFDIAKMQPALEKLKKISENLTPRQRMEKDTWIRNVIKQYGWTHAEASKHYDRIKSAQNLDKKEL